jgi:predicted phosphodiesterase
LRVIKKIGFIGDVHGEDDILYKAINNLKKEKIDIILCTGDIVDGNGDVNRCCELLKNNEILTVIGNHDRWLLNNEMRTLSDATLHEELSDHSIIYLSNLPSIYIFKMGEYKCILCHGVGSNDMSKISEDDYGYAIDVNEELQDILGKRFKIMFNGHSHKRMVKIIRNLCIINAGTLKKEHNPCYSIVDIELKEVIYFYFDENGKVKKSEIIQIECL